MGYVFGPLLGESFALTPCQGDDESKWQNCEGILITEPRITSSSGVKYVRVFKDGIFDGENENNVKYIGEYKNGTMNGQGTHTYSDGNKYVGEFRDGSRHGQGTYTSANGTVQEGVWKNDKFQYAKKDPKVEERRKVESGAEK